MGGVLQTINVNCKQNFFPGVDGRPPSYELGGALSLYAHGFCLHAICRSAMLQVWNLSFGSGKKLDFDVIFGLLQTMFAVKIWFIN